MSQQHLFYQLNVHGKTTFMEHLLARIQEGWPLATSWADGERQEEQDKLPSHRDGAGTFPPLPPTK